MFQCPKYMLGYSDIMFPDGVEDYPTKFVKKNGIVLYCHSEYISIKEIGRLLDYALRNKAEVVGSQHPYIHNDDFRNNLNQFSRNYRKLYGIATIDGYCSYVHSIDQASINHILSDSNLSEFDSLLQFSVSLGVDNSGVLGFYAKNDSVYLYIRKQKIKELRLSLTDNIEVWDSVLKERIEEELYAFKNINFVNTYKPGEGIISVDDTTFYQYSLTTRELTGPFVLPPYDVEFFPERRLSRKVTVTGEKLMLTAENYFLAYSVEFDLLTGVFKVDTSKYSNINFEIRQARESQEAEKEQVALQERLKKEKQRNVLILMSLVVIVNLLLATTKRL